MKIFTLLTLLLLSLVIPACAIEPDWLMFDSDPRILRGVWQGIYQEDAFFLDDDDEGQPIKLVLTASYLSEHQYSVKGTLQIAAETPLNIEATMTGGDYQLYSQVPAPMSPRLEGVLQDATGKVIGSLSGYSYFYARDASYEGNLEIDNKTHGPFRIRPQ
jgi:hypothetical protein